MTAFSWTEKGADGEPATSEPESSDPAAPSTADALAPFASEVRHVEMPEPDPARAAPGKRPKADPPGSHPNAKRVRDCYAALERRDLETAFKDFSPGFKLEVPAQLPFDPGDVRGPIVVMGLIRKMLELTGGQFKNELLSVTATDDLAVALNRVTVTRRGKSRTYHTSWTYRVVGDKIVEGWL
ncbi:MAG TPA: nuclear transport factor 2 family protein, partial [Candidatus Dormibacteraeota bacterium]|nr:nuclear transport factor 2 family protein [Candidatus Dormibacteraeota bacterium]